MAREASLWARYCALMQDPEGGLEWHQWLEDDALVVVGGAAIRRAQLPSTELAQAHRNAVNALGASGGFPWSQALLGEPEWVEEAGGKRALLWVSLAPPDAPVQEGGLPWPEALRLAMGLSWVEGDWRISFVLLEGLVLKGSSWDACRAAAWAECSYLPSQNERCSRDWPEVAFRRRHRPGAPPIRHLPEARFGCHFTGTCCRQTWDITAPPEAQAVLDAIPWDEVAPELAGVRLQPREDGLLLVKARGSNCQFLNEAGQCRLHLRFGMPIFAACTVFPFRFAKTPDGVDVVASSHCQSARDNLGPPLESRRLELYQRLGMAPVLLAPDGYRLSPELQVPWARFQAAESALLNVLEEGHDPQDLNPLRRALAVAQAWADGQESAAEAPLDSSPLGALEEITRLNFLPFFINAIAVKHEELACTRDQLPSTGACLHPKDHARAMRWMRQLLFSKEFSFAMDLQSAIAICAILYLFLVVHQEHSNESPISEATWTLLGTMASHGTITQRLKMATQELPFLLQELPRVAEYGLRHLRWGGP